MYLQYVPNEVKLTEILDYINCNIVYFSSQQCCYMVYMYSYFGYPIRHWFNLSIKATEGTKVFKSTNCIIKNLWSFTFQTLIFKVIDNDQNSSIYKDELHNLLK